MTFKFLGTGTSVGVPQIGCKCPVCTSTDPRDKRRRCGAYVRSGDVAFLIDTPPEMRLACIEYGIDKVDAIVLTHAHMDHIAGFDDVRRFNTLNGTKVACDPNEPGANGRTFKIIGKPMTCYAMPETAEQMHRIFPYIGLQGGEHGLFRPQIGFDTADAFTIGDVRVERLRVEHGFPCCGYGLASVSRGSRNSRNSRNSRDARETSDTSNSRDTRDTRSSRDARDTRDTRDTRSSRESRDTSNSRDSREASESRAARYDLAYVSDCHVIPDEAIAKMAGCDTLVLNCLRERQHPTHLSLEAALGYVDRIKPQRCFLIHMCHDLTHRQWLEKLAGTNVEPAYDGLELEV